jgi:dsRNA-specific ribonuclease
MMPPKIFIEKRFFLLLEILSSGSWLDPKSGCRKLPKIKKDLPLFIKCCAKKVPTTIKFAVGVFVDNQLKGEGEGPSKQAAQVAAASQALKHYE